MTQLDVSRAWIETGKRLAVDPSVEAPYPRCRQAVLGVQDVPIAGSHRFERAMSCPALGDHSFLLLAGWE